MRSKKALVLGVSGMVGGALAEELVADGWYVYGAARFRSSQRLEEIKKLEIDAIGFDVIHDDPSMLPDVDVVFLEIWDPDRPELIWPINFYGVGRVIERDSGIADIVNGCTINVYGESAVAPCEDAPLRPTGEYGHSRVAQERLIQYFAFQGGQKAIHVRYAHSNAPGRGVIWRMANSILAGDSLGTDPDSKIQVIALEDFVRVTKEAVTFVANPVASVNCCHPKVWTRRELANEIQNKLGQGTVVFDRASGGEKNSAYADVGRMLDWFGEPQVDLETLFDRIIQSVEKDKL
jgi:nucleoside-diphosphate-sugar epimerase